MDLLTGMTESVAPHLARDSAYMIVVASPLYEHVLPADRILLDADQVRLRKNLFLLDGKLCAVRRSTPAGDIIELCRVTCRRGEAASSKGSPQVLGSPADGVVVNSSCCESAFRRPTCGSMTTHCGASAKR